jgi:SAM-dependent methyltransferase
MEPSGRILRRRIVDHGSLHADADLIAEIAADMQAHAGAYLPGASWLTLDTWDTAGAEDVSASAFTPTAISDKMGSSEQLLPEWIGVQSQPALGSSADRYAAFLSRHDPLELWVHNIENSSIATTLMEADLGSMLDLNLLYTFAPDRSPTRVIEIGGGYGRTAEAALNVFAGSVTWVMVDAVPASLGYARDYLRAACPDARIGFYYDGDAADIKNFDCYIAPAWHFQELNGGERYDVCVNIESFQEMTQAAVDAYIGLFDRIADDDAIFYLSNAHDYQFRGSWNYPPTWRRLFCSNTPRSWTRDHPTEVFARAAGDHVAVNAAIEAAYRLSLQSWVPPGHGVPIPMLEELDADREALRSRVAALDADLEIVRNSMSWRVTRPFAERGSMASPTPGPPPRL